MTTLLLVHEPGRVPYTEAWALQQRLAQARAAGGPDRLLLLEHPHVFTLGTRGDAGHVVWSEAECTARACEVVRTDRGGDVTYHGPGQLVVYPIVQIARVPGSVSPGVIAYVRRLEAVVSAFLAGYGVRAFTIPGMTGVWVNTPAGDAKIAAIGVRVSARGVSTHGIGLNLNTDLRYFDGIIPCGIRDKGVTSLAALLGRPVDEAEARRAFVQHFAEVFDCAPAPAPLPHTEVAP